MSIEPVLQERAPRRELVGQVVSDKMQKTIVVRVTRLVRHPQYERVIRRAQKFKAHDERNEARIGDRVLIAETRPISKDKRWRLVKIVERINPEMRKPLPGDEAVQQPSRPTVKRQPQQPTVTGPAPA